METSEEQQVKGHVMKDVCTIVERHKGEGGLNQLEHLYGPLKFESSRLYPVSEEIKLHKDAIKVIYGAYTDEYYKKLAKDIFRIFAESFIGKTMFAIVGIGKIDLQKIALAAHNVTSAIAQGRYYDVSLVAQNTVAFTMPHSPYPSSYWIGIFEATLEYLKVKGNITIAVNNPEQQKYIINWN